MNYKNKFDLHVHSMYSHDAISKPRNLVKVALKRNLTGFTVSDHNQTKAWVEMSRLCKKNNLLFIQGQEISCLKNEKPAGELLALFLQEKIKSREVDEVIDEIKQQNALLVVPHPFARLRKHFLFLKDYLKKINAIEVMNSHCYFNSWNEKAKKFAEENFLSITAGSDAHSSQELGNSFISCNAQSLEELKKAILKKKVKAYGKIIPLWVQLRTWKARFKLNEKDL